MLDLLLRGRSIGIEMRATLTVTLCMLCAFSCRADDRPNIIFIFTDDHAAHALSAYGSRINETPHLDRIAREGALFQNCFCGNGICGPSRATVLTGLHSHANGFRRNGDRFDGDQPTFPKMLQAAGYRTAMMGKWHLSSDPQGFDAWEILPGQGRYYNPDFISAEGKVRREGYVTDLITDRALAWLESAADPDQPFLLMLQHKAPHREWMPGPQELHLYEDVTIPEPPDLFDDGVGRSPAFGDQEMTIDRHMWMFYDLFVPPDDPNAELTGPDRWARGRLDRMNETQRKAWQAAYGPRNEVMRAQSLTGDDLVRWKYQRYIKNYLRCVAGVDRNVGRVLDWLDEHDRADRTVVIYCSDQGFFLGDHGWYDKRWMYEESLRMPLLVRWPGVIESGAQIEALVQNIDFAPTFLDMAGVRRPDGMHGVSMVPLFDGHDDAEWRDAVYYHYYESRATHRVAAHEGVRTDRYKLIHYYEPEYATWELFDLVRDPDERQSVHDDPQYATIRRRLEERLVQLKAQYDVPAPETP